MPLFVGVPALAGLRFAKNPPDLERRLHQAASKKGQPTEQFTLQLIDENLPRGEKPPAINVAAIQMLRAWAKEAEEMTDEESAENEAILRSMQSYGNSWIVVELLSWAPQEISFPLAFRAVILCNKGSAVYRIYRR